MFTLRDSSPADREFLMGLFASGRQALVAAAGWDAATVNAFLAMQYEAQQRGYGAAYPAARCQVIGEGRGAQPIGQLWVDRRRDAFHLLDISLVAQRRGQGIGGQVLRALQDEATAAAAPLTLLVDPSNAAMRLYLRLGFVAIGGQPPDIAMRWIAGKPRAADPQPGPNPLQRQETCDEQA